MKNCRKKMRGVVRGSLWSDQEFNARMRKLTSRNGRKAVEFTGIRSVDEPFSPVITQDDWNHAVKVLQDFIDMEPDFVKYVEDERNWEHVDGYIVDENDLEPLNANNIEF